MAGSPAGEVEDVLWRPVEAVVVVASAALRQVPSAAGKLVADLRGGEAVELLAQSADVEFRGIALDLPSVSWFRARSVQGLEGWLEADEVWPASARWPSAWFLLSDACEGVSLRFGRPGFYVTEALLGGRRRSREPVDLVEIAPYFLSYHCELIGAVTLVAPGLEEDSELAYDDGRDPPALYLDPGFRHSALSWEAPSLFVSRDSPPLIARPVAEFLSSAAMEAPPASEIERWTESTLRRFGLGDVAPRSIDCSWSQLAAPKDAQAVDRVGTCRFAGVRGAGEVLLFVSKRTSLGEPFRLLRIVGVRRSIGARSSGVVSFSDSQAFLSTDLDGDGHAEIWIGATLQSATARMRLWLLFIDNGDDLLGPFAFRRKECAGGPR